MVTTIEQEKLTVRTKIQNFGPGIIFEIRIMQVEPNLNRLLDEIDLK